MGDMSAWQERGEHLPGTPQSQESSANSAAVQRGSKRQQGPEQALTLAQQVMAGLDTTRLSGTATYPEGAGPGAQDASAAETARAGVYSSRPGAADVAVSSAGPGVADLSDDEDENAAFQSFITGRMAKLQRDPNIARIQRLLASRRRTRSRLTELTLTLDLTLSIIALLLAQQYRDVLSHVVPVYLYVHVFGISDTLLLGGLIIVIWPVVFSLFGLYRPSWIANRFSALRVLGAVLVCSLSASGILYFLYADRTRWFLLSFTALDAVLLTALRLLLRPLASVRALRRRVLIVGTGRLAIDAARAVASRRKQGMELVGTVGPERPPLSEPVEFDEWAAKTYLAWTPPRLGDVHETPQVVRDREVDLILIALTPRERREASWVLSSMASLPVQVYVVPDVTTETAKTAVDVIDGMPIVGLSESAISGWALRIKRLMDLMMCIPALLILWPLMVAIAIAIRLDSPGPALFKQERVGQHNRRFKIYKFRTMYVDAERRARELAVRTEEGLIHKQRGDPRISRVGALLRRTSLDELPQLLNVLKGDMSVVGPRPEMPWIVERYRAWQYRRLLVPQGITGWWQVHGRSERVLHLHTQDDIYYVRNFSLWLDVKILLMTIKAVFTGKGAF
jgi:exopolysaccharide biosynthesis polyprenyl glycosylphosphotransferase